MKKIFLAILIGSLVSSCSMLGSGPTPTPAPTSTYTRTAVPSATPTVPTPTFTNTPTLIVFAKTDTPTAESLPTLAPDIVTFPVSRETVTPAPSMKGFISILVSGKEFYKGKKCAPASVNFTVQVSEPWRSAYVVLFVRFKSKRTGVTSEWTSIKMENKGAGTFTHDLTSVEMIGDTSFTNPWVEYQLVTTQANTRELGRTDIFSERLSLLECHPELTPQVSSTPTASTP